MYKITILRIDENVPYKTREWKKFSDNEELEKQYDFFEVDGVKNVETQVLEQIVDNLDLPAVIKAVNNLE